VGSTLACDIAYSNTFDVHNEFVVMIKITCS